MLTENLLLEIGFTTAEQQEYFKYKTMIGDKLNPYAEAFMNGDLPFLEALETTRKFQSAELHQHTVDLLFALECAGLLQKNYEEKGIPHSIFIDTMRDIKYKLDECRTVKNVFGMFVIDWYEGFYKMTRFALGRLQYDVTTFKGEDTVIADYKLSKGDFLLECHIPSSGPLLPEDCVDSLKRAYTFFKDQLKDGVLPVLCQSWLLYPPYLEQVFGTGSNLFEFASCFEILQGHDEAWFGDAWRIFGMDYDGDPDKLPINTTLQRSFVDYMKTGQSFGWGSGVILFDGEKILTKK